MEKTKLKEVKELFNQISKEKQEREDRNFYYKEYSERFKKANIILILLKDNARLKLSKISEKTGIPISTIFDVFNATISKDFKFITKRK